MPFTYEFYKINVWRLIAPERSVWNNNYQSNRDIGITAWGGLFENRMEYAVMLHNGPRNGFQAYDYPKSVAAFLNFKPFEPNEDSFLRDLNYRRLARLRLSEQPRRADRVPHQRQRLERDPDGERPEQQRDTSIPGLQ